MASSPGRLQGGQAPRRGLVRAPTGGTARSGLSDSSIMPWLADTARRRASSSAPRAPALAWGRRPVSSTHGAARGHQVVDRRGVAVLVEPAAGRRVAVLGALAQGEQRLVAAGAPPGAGDGQHLVEGRGRGTRPGPGPWRRCSSRTGRGTAWSSGMNTLGEKVTRFPCAASRTRRGPLLQVGRGRRRAGRRRGQRRSAVTASAQPRSAGVADTYRRSRAPGRRSASPTAAAVDQPQRLLGASTRAAGRSAPADTPAKASRLDAPDTVKTTSRARAMAWQGEGDPVVGVAAVGVAVGARPARPGSASPGRPSPGTARRCGRRARGRGGRGRRRRAADELALVGRGGLVGVPDRYMGWIGAHRPRPRSSRASRTRRWLESGSSGGTHRSSPM